MPSSSAPTRFNRRAWCISAIAWLLVAFAQSPGLTSADTKHDLTANPWEFLHQALSPWTDVFPLGQLQNQAYGYLFPHGLFFAIGDWLHLPDWITQRLWWWLLLFLAFAGVIRLLEALDRTFVLSTTARVIAGILFALSPRILSTLGAISSEAWVVALAPWALLPVIRAIHATHRSHVAAAQNLDSRPHATAQQADADTHTTASHNANARPHLAAKQNSGSHKSPGLHAYVALQALSSAVIVLMMGAVNAVASMVAVLPAIIFWALWLLHSLASSRTRAAALTFTAVWVPSGILATFWWIGPLLILGSYSPPFTDYIESASLTTRWLSPLEVLRGTTSWVPFLSTERVAGHALVIEPVFIVGTVAVALIGLWGLSALTWRTARSAHSARNAHSHRTSQDRKPSHTTTEPQDHSQPSAADRIIIRALIATLTTGLVMMISAYSPLSPWSQAIRDILDGSGAPLRNLHKFDILVRLPLVIGVAYAFRNLHAPQLAPLHKPALRHTPLRKPTLRHTPLRLATESLKPLATRIAHPERNPRVVQAIAITLLIATVTAPAWSGRLAAAEPYTNVPRYWADAAHYLNTTAGEKTGLPTALQPRTLILPEARFGRQTWGNTRDEPAQPLLDVPWVVRDSVPLVQPEAIRGLDGLNTALNSGRSIPTLAATLRNNGIGYILVRSDLIAASDTPGSAQILRTIRRSGGFTHLKTFGDNSEIHIYATGTPTQAQQAGAARVASGDTIERTLAGPEALPRLDEADAALGRTSTPRPRILTSDNAQTSTDTPGLRDHNYGNVTNADSAIRATDDPTKLLNPVRDYPARPYDWMSSSVETNLPRTHVAETGGRVTASTSADGPTNFTGAETTSSITAAVDGHTATAWRPAPGIVAGEWLELKLDKPTTRMGLTIDGQGRGARVQVTTFLGDRTVASTTTSVTPKEPAQVSVPGLDADRVRLTIVNSFGDFGISEVTIQDSDGNDITPRRIADVPQPYNGDGGEGGNGRDSGEEAGAGGDGRDNSAKAGAGTGTEAGETAGAGTVSPTNRWIFGQEINEGVMTRQFTLDREVPLVIHTDRCRDQHRGQLNTRKARIVAGVTIDGKTYICGDTLTLKKGTHTLSSPATWVALTLAEPLYAAAVAQTPEPQVLTTPANNERSTQPGSLLLDIPADNTGVNSTGGNGAGGNTGGHTGGHAGGQQNNAAGNTSTGYHMPAADERVLWLPSQANPGRTATLRKADGTEQQLAPLVMNGWQQGWLIPAGASGTVEIFFDPTSTYHSWLKVGLAAALALMITWFGMLLITRRRGTRQQWVAQGMAQPQGLEDDAEQQGATDGSEQQGLGVSEQSSNDGAQTSRWSSRTPLEKAGAVAFGVGGSIVVIGAARGPWGSQWYAGDSWAVNIAMLALACGPLVTLLVAPLASKFSASPSRRKTGDSRPTA